MLLWSPRSRGVVLTVFALVVTVVFVLPLGTVVLAGLAAVAVLMVPETSPRTGRLGVQRLAVPPQARAVFKNATGGRAGSL